MLWNRRIYLNLIHLAQISIWYLFLSFCLWAPQSFFIYLFLFSLKALIQGVNKSIALIGLELEPFSLLSHKRLMRYCCHPAKQAGSVDTQVCLILELSHSQSIILKLISTTKDFVWVRISATSTLWLRWEVRFSENIVIVITPEGSYLEFSNLYHRYNC